MQGSTFYKKNRDFLVWLYDRQHLGKLGIKTGDWEDPKQVAAFADKIAELYDLFEEEQNA